MKIWQCIGSKKLGPNNLLAMYPWSTFPTSTPWPMSCKMGQLPIRQGLLFTLGLLGVYCKTYHITNKLCKFWCILHNFIHPKPKFWSHSSEKHKTKTKAAHALLMLDCTKKNISLFSKSLQKLPAPIIILDAEEKASILIKMTSPKRYQASVSRHPQSRSPYITQICFEKSGLQQFLITNPNCSAQRR